MNPDEVTTSENVNLPAEQETVEQVNKIKLEPGTLIYLFKQVGFDDNDIPILLAIAQMESNMVHGAINYNSESGYDKDLGILQLNNLANFDKDLQPDRELQVFMAKENITGMFTPNDFAEMLHQDIMFQMRWAKHKIDWHRKAGKDPFIFWMTYPPIRDYIQKGDKTYAPRQEDFDLAMKYYEDYKNNRIVPISKDVPMLPPIEVSPRPVDDGQSRTTVPEKPITVEPQKESDSLTTRSEGITNMFGSPEESFWNKGVEANNYRDRNASQVMAMIQAAVNSQRRTKNLPDISNNLNVDTQFAQLTDDQKTILDILRDINGS